jgi:hypothetical protein
MELKVRLNAVTFFSLSVLLGLASMCCMRFDKVKLTIKVIFVYIAHIFMRGQSEFIP